MASPIQTVAQNLSIAITNVAYVNNTWQRVFAKVFLAGTIQLATSADANGNGQIIVAGNVQASSITLNSTESGSGAGGIVQSSGTLTATGAVSLIDGASGAGTGAIGSSSVPIQTAAPQLSVATISNAFVSNSGAVILQPSSAANLTLASTSSITAAGNTTATGVLTLNTSDLEVPAGNALKGASVFVNGPIGTDLTFNNAGIITATAGSVNITSNPTVATGTNFGNLLVSGGGTINATTFINLTASTVGTVTNGITFNGGQTFNANTFWNAVGPNQFINLNGKTVSIAGGDSLTINTQAGKFVSGGGTITGTSGFGTPAASVTIAQSTIGNIDISTLGSLTLKGANLAIVSAGGITDGGTTTINLSSTTGNGGNLTLIAGYSFSGGPFATPTQTGACHARPRLMQMKI